MFQDVLWPDVGQYRKPYYGRVISDVQLSGSLPSGAFFACPVVHPGLSVWVMIFRALNTARGFQVRPRRTMVATDGIDVVDSERGGVCA